MSQSVEQSEERKLYEDLCRLYESGCSHDEAFAAVGAVTQKHVEVLGQVVKGFGHEDGLAGLRDFCVRRARARLKGAIMCAAEEAKDATKILAALQAIDKISEESGSVDLVMEEDLVKQAIAVLGLSDNKSILAKGKKK